jgi:hypothetical protein
MESGCRFICGGLRQLPIPDPYRRRFSSLTDMPFPKGIPISSDDIFISTHKQFNKLKIGKRRIIISTKLINNSTNQQFNN